MPSLYKTKRQKGGGPKRDEREKQIGTIILNFENIITYYGIRDDIKQHFLNTVTKIASLINILELKEL